MFAECLRESAAADLQQTDIGACATSTASDEMALILHGKASHKQDQERAAEQCREFGGERESLHGAECLERLGGIASGRCAKHITAKLRNAAPMWPPSKAATISARCIDSARGEMVRAPTNGQMRANKERNAHACAKYRMMRQKSTLATFRNIPANNGSVIMQTTQA